MTTKVFQLSGKAKTILEFVRLVAKARGNITLNDIVRGNK